MSHAPRVLLLLAASLLFVLSDLSLTFAGEIVRGPVRVCRKPMLAGNASLAALVNPGPDAWRQLAERQAEEIKYCYMAGDIELAEKGAELDVGGNTKCTEWQAIANGDRVFVVIGSRDRTWGRCP
jgi:hypothetical protein